MPTHTAYEAVKDLLFRLSRGATQDTELDSLPIEVVYRRADGLLEGYQQGLFHSM